MKSIIQKNKRCWSCANPHVEEHHCIHGNANRKLSEKYGLKIWLCETHHRLGNQSVHMNADRDLKIKKMAQRRFQEVYPELDFLKIFGRNYL